jgi:hypothetical protein
VHEQEEVSITEQLRDVARQWLRYSASGMGLIQPPLSEQGFTTIVSNGGGQLRGRPLLLSGWVSVGITTEQLALVEQGRADEVEDLHLTLQNNGRNLAQVHLTSDGTVLNGWENIPFESKMTPREKLQWLHEGMVASHAAMLEEANDDQGSGAGEV